MLLFFSLKFDTKSTQNAHMPEISIWNTSLHTFLIDQALKEVIIKELMAHFKENKARYVLTQDDLARKVGVRRETILS